MKEDDEGGDYNNNNIEEKEDEENQKEFQEYLKKMNKGGRSISGISSNSTKSIHTVQRKKRKGDDQSSNTNNTNRKQRSTSIKKEKIDKHNQQQHHNYKSINIGNNVDFNHSDEEEEEEEDPVVHMKKIKLVSGKDNKSIKFREPGDIQRSDRHNLTRGGAIEKEKVKQPLGPLKVLPRPENQNEYTLGQPYGQRRGEFPLLDEGDESPRIRYKYNNPNHIHQQDTFALEDLLHKGFLPYYHRNNEDVLYAASNDLHQQCQLIKGKNEELVKSGMMGPSSYSYSSSSTLTTSTNTTTATTLNNNNNNQQQQSSTTSIASTTTGTGPFNWEIPSYGWNAKTGKTELHETMPSFIKDYHERFELFFMDDQLEYDTDTQIKHRPPKEYACYRQLVDTMKNRFEERINYSKEAALRVPKFDDEPPITKQWIEEYRMRPITSDELCSKGEHCQFNIFNKKDNIHYIGRVFETPREVKEKKEGKQNPYRRNIKRLCIDCILYEWTKDTMENISSEKAQEVQMNYFTVLCEPGQYNKECMLSVMWNNKPTGIVGFVPEYKSNNRISVPITTTMLQGDLFVSVTTNYIAETNMDF